MALSYKALLERSTDTLHNDILPHLWLVNPLPDSLKCYHCGQILKKPHQLSCGHRICLKCFDEFKENLPINSNGVKYCVEDDEELDGDSFPDISALKEILYLDCYCLRKNDGCLWQGDIKDVEEHLQTCQYNVQFECEFKQLGCKFKGSKSRLEDHMITDEPKHNAYLSTTITEVSKEVEVHKSKLENVKKKEQRISKSFGEFQKDIGELREEMDQVKKKIADKKKEKEEEVDFDFEGRLQRLKENKDTMLEWQSKLEDEIKKAENLTELVKLSTGENMSYEKQIEAIDQKLVRMGISHKENEEQMKDIELKTKLYQSTTFNGTFIWKLDNLKKRFLDAVSGKVTELLTPPLYTSRYGYKFCAKLLLNGDVELGERSQHIALYIIVMRGDYDEILTWPFRNLIKVTLLNMDKKRGDIERVIIPRTELPHFNKPTKMMNNAIGFPRFCSHDSFHSDGFVRDDSVFIKIEVEEATAEL